MLEQEKDVELILSDEEARLLNACVLDSINMHHFVESESGFPDLKQRKRQRLQETVWNAIYEAYKRRKMLND